MDINHIAANTYYIAENKGFFTGEVNVGEKLALIHAEVSEALEEARENTDLNHIYFTQDKDGNAKPEGFPIELADVILRTLQISEYYGIDINKCIKMKEKYNNTRVVGHNKLF